VTRITIIDDDRDVLDLFRDVFEERGYHVETFADAMPGIAQLIASRPDVLIIDLQLDPEREQLSGLQVVHSARSGTELRDTPIIVCTADVIGLRTAWPGFMERGDIHQLEKPFDLATLDRVIETALQMPHGPEVDRRDRRGTLRADGRPDEQEA
jgi:two-component system, NtrC family, nitrogen regulation response regulator NtrX